MKPSFKTTGIKKSELNTFNEVISGALGVPKKEYKLVIKWLTALGIPNIRVVRDGNTLAGGLQVIYWGHFFGGKSIPAAGITFVGIAPEYRRAGACSKLLSDMLHEQYENKMPISTLYPANIPLYRKAGYECAMEHAHIKIKLQDIDINNRDLDIVPYKGIKALKDVYTKYMRTTNGNVDRDEYTWKTNVNGIWSKGRKTYLVKRGKEIEGYIIISSPDGEKPMRIHDMIYLTRDAAERLLTFLADHSSIFKEAKLTTSSTDQITEFLTYRACEFKRPSLCMLRIVHVPEALKARGYTKSVDAEIHFEIEDDILKGNNGRFVLSVKNGKGSVKKGGQGRIKLDIRSLAQLYSSFYTPADLKFASKIAGSDSELAKLAPVFSGPRPWIREDF